MADACLSPVLRHHVAHLTEALAGVRLLFMQSNGGLVAAHAFQGKDAILSGPAGGVVGGVRTALRAGFTHIVGFDMGGTSTDVWHFQGTDKDAYERVSETVVGGVRLRVPMLHIHTVAAGGGSLLHPDALRFRVGPESAGADPGPMSYHRGGPLTVTDANVLLGRLQPGFFPAVFGPNADAPLDKTAVEKAFGHLAARLGQTPEAVAEGFLAIAIDTMARAIRRISVERGHDITTAVLCCFGGAGGQHACRLADRLGIGTVFLHPLAGVLSAYGMGLAEMRTLRERSLEEPLAEGVLNPVVADLTTLTRADLIAQGVPAHTMTTRCRCHVKYAGSDSALEVPFGPVAAIGDAFTTAHRRRFGFVTDQPLMVERVCVEAIEKQELFGIEPASLTADEAKYSLTFRDADTLRARASQAEDGRGVLPVRGSLCASSSEDDTIIGTPSFDPPSPAFDPPSPASETVCVGRVTVPPPVATVAMAVEGIFTPTPVHARGCLPVGARLNGPALIAEAHATTVLEPGWQTVVNGQGALILTRIGPRSFSSSPGDGTVDPARLEIFNSLFMSVAEQMGAVLQNTAHSVNIKERLDYPCAVFDAAGNLVANAPHIPVHLGSMSDSVRAILRAHRQDMLPGDVYCSNAPYNGGGLTPGSMPPGSRTILEEGILIDDFRLVRAGRCDEEVLRALLRGGPWPARVPARNLANLKAQSAANETGVAELKCLVATYGLAVVRAFMGHIQANAAESVRRVIDRLHDGTFAVEMDDGAVIRVALRIDRTARRAVMDFTGTAPQSSGNTNAPRAITRAAVLYVFRTLVEDPIPLNEGCLAPVTIVIPPGSLLDPRPPGGGGRRQCGNQPGGG
ncbi:MAG: 5-oxoprolinase (ATP-hydrolysing) [Rhodospirillaceae bacterium]|nr:MAG: 5-oxoprolinase (ATP-hydrolysing) [Rhodospirillaceae bacterium]